MNVQIKLLSLKFRTVGKQEPQYGSSYEMVLSSEALEKISEDKEKQGHLAPSSVTDILRTSVHQEEAYIPGDWISERYSFTMELELSRNQSFSPVKLVVRGFTKDAYLTEDSELYLNSIVTYQKVRIMSEFGPRDEEVVTNTTHILTNHDNNNNGKRIGRPSDIFSAMACMMITREMGSTMMQNVVDFRNLYHDVMNVSSMENDVPNLFLEKMIECHKNSKELLSFGNGVEDLYSRAHSLTFEEDYGVNGFIQYVSRVLNKPRSSVIPMKVKDLTMFGNYRSIMKVLPAGNYKTYGEMEVLSLYDGKVEDTLARCIGVVLPRIMSKANMNSVRFDVKWDDSIMGYVSFLTAAEATVSVDNPMSEEISISEKSYRLFHLDADAFFNRGLPWVKHAVMGFEVDARLDGEAFISVKVSGQDYFTYTYPLFASSLVVPVIHKNQESVNNLADSIEQVLDILN